MRHLHYLVENELEAPALAWNILAYYWGMSAFGLGPAYKDYMQSDKADQDRIWNDPSNAALNRPVGLSRSLSIKERFDRAANFYLYCYEQGRRTAINPPFDAPPTLDELILSRLRMETKAPPPSKLIEASTEAVLGDRSELRELWATGGQEQRQQRAQAYNARILETLRYIASEIDSLQIITPDQLSETGFLIEGLRGEQYNVTAEFMDEVMPEEVQDKKFGECYIQKTPSGINVVLSGIFGAYYTMGHNLELAMFDEESKTRLSSTHHAIMHTWRQLYDINAKENT